MLEVTKYAVQIELIEDMLGTVPKNREVYSSFIAAKGRKMLKKQAKEGIHPAGHVNGESIVDRSGELTEQGDAVVTALLEEEVETIQEVEERGWTGFHEDEDGPFLFDYALKGYLSEAARTLKQYGKGEGAVKQLQDKFKQYVFVKPRRIRLPKPGKVESFTDKPMLVITDKGVVCERPLRAQTAQGERVTVTRSDVVLAGAILNFELHVIPGSPISKPIIEEVLAYGEYLGLGQWRSGGWGRFEVRSLAKL